MARWGEGDPRWIVEERPDATNVNNWHWTEKNACGWSKDKLKDLLVNLEIDSEVALVRITEMDRIEGEAVVNNRKGKLIFFYEWDINLTWKGRLKGGTSGEHEGKIFIPNLSEENNLKEVEIQVTLKDSEEEGEIIKEYLHLRGKEKIREKLGYYISSLKDEFTKGMILPQKNKEISEARDSQISNLSSGLANKVQMNHYNDISINNKGQRKLAISKLKLTQTFQCRGDEFYRAMTNPEMVQAFTNGPIKLESKTGGKFELFGGNILGEFIELVPDKKIVQKWRIKCWPEDLYSIVTLNIEEQEDHTLVKLCQTGIPESEIEGTKENWSRYYWDAIKRKFGWGYFM